MRESAGAEVVQPRGGAQALAGKHHVGGDPEQLVGDLRRPVGVEHHGDAALARRRADRPHEIRKPVVGEQGIGGGDEAGGVGGRGGGDAGIAIGDDHAIAAGIDEDRRQRGRHAGNALAAAAVDLLARERGQHAIAVAVLAGRAAERAGERRPPAEPRNGDRRIGGAAAVDDEESLGLRLAVRRREALDLKDLIEHDDAGAQDRRLVPAGACAIGSQSPAPPRRG